jgi:hypothetical protein
MRIRIKRPLRNYLLKKFPIFRGCEFCQDAIPHLRERLCKNFKIEFPIDIIYTWVDGSSSSHRAKKLLYTSGKEHSDGLSAARFRNSGELRYSLRSLEEYAPWVNHIYLVTDQQVPEWLNRRNKKISIIDHAEIIPHKYLPTFNSHVIESYLHLIPSLSQHYVYFNDDFFLCSPTTPEYFFTHNGLPLIFVDWRHSRLAGFTEKKTPHACSFFNVLNVLYKNYKDEIPFFITQHGPYSQTKENAYETFSLFSDNIKDLSKNKFRSVKDIAFYCHAAPLLSVYQKKSIPCDISYYYINIEKVDRQAYYNHLLNNKNKSESSLPIYMALNDTSNKSFNGTADMYKFLKLFFPKKSNFEI